MKYLHISFVLILLVGLLGLLTACGESPPTVEAILLPPPILRTGLPIDNAPLQSVVAAMHGVTSYHFVMITDLGTGATPPTDGDVIPPNKMFTTSRYAAAGQTSEQKQIRVNHQWWTLLAGQWARTFVEYGGGFDVHPEYPLDLVLIDTVADGEDLGDEIIAGVATRHLRYQGMVAGATGAGEIWVDKSTNYMVQVKFRDGSATVLIRYSRFNDPSIKIEPPQ